MKLLYKLKDNYAGKVNWTLLLFIILVLNVKMPVKIGAVFFFLFLNRRLFLQKDFYRRRFIWFYFSLIAIGLINVLLIIPSVTVPYLVAVLVGILFWLLCAGTSFLNSWFVDQTETGKLHNTITLFFILNAFVTLGQLGLIILDSGSLNPFIYQGMRQKYFINTGDLMTGISFDVSTTNAILNAFGIVYFLKRNKLFLVLLCMMVLLLTSSNFTNVLLLFVLVFIFIFQSTRDQKTMVGVCLFLMVIFMARVSPQNDNYIIGAYNKIFNKNVKAIGNAKTVIPVTEKPDSILTAEEKKQKTARLYLDSLAKASLKKSQEADSIKRTAGQLPAPLSLTSKPSVPKPNIHTEPFQRRRDTSLFQKELLNFATANIPSFDTSLAEIKSRKLTGKMIGFRQTYAYLKAHPFKIITGTGMGNFSSKLAFRATGLKMAGGYPKTMIYINDDFRDNHLSLYLHYFSKDRELHSLVNSPNAIYDQLIAEYGIAGIFVFIFFYIAFFIKRLKGTRYGVPLLLILLGAFFVDYWYEQLSIVIIFELVMLTGIKETTEANERS